jgi:hypothetical protein
MPAILQIITPEAVIKILSSLFNLALICSYRKAQTSSCELSLAAVASTVAIYVTP